MRAAEHGSSREAHTCAAATGRQAVQRLLASSALASSRRVGVYVSCDRLCEVNTGELLRFLLRPGACDRSCRAARRLTSAALHSGSVQHCFAPLVGAAAAQMEFYRLGAVRERRVVSCAPHALPSR